MAWISRASSWPCLLVALPQHLQAGHCKCTCKCILQAEDYLVGLELSFSHFHVQNLFTQKRDSAFALLCLLCGELLPEYYSPAMPGLHAGQDVLMEALRLCLPSCHARLGQAQVPVREHSTHWLLCLYINVLPLCSAMRLWDLLFAEVRKYKGVTLLQVSE